MPLRCYNGVEGAAERMGDRERKNVPRDKRDGSWARERWWLQGTTREEGRR